MSFETVQRFAFDRVFTEMGPTPFDMPDSMLDQAALRAELDARKADHENALSIARADAFEAGLAQARTERDAALLCAIDAMHGALDALDARFAETTRRIVADATDVALAAADAIAGRALVRDPTGLIDDGIGRVLQQVARGTELQVRVHPDLVEAVEQRVATRQAADRRKLHVGVVPDATLAPGDALIDWEQGGLLLERAARLAAVESELASLLPPPPTA
ncbi:FliH/SctL family protein [Sphingomonas echinoides]|jgi:flagellar assembly protein FliH|uniref:Flagellar assembly protein FliH n=2 Tax=Pseudomonadota TaxID=1224 RepID=A0ABU4PPD1_9SPHN|nr:FliH/SctL family protein [Sphingomonas echinoides]MDX5985996.1 FliH/SctL family protein [Sphingomonas echinoides]